jgi:hypothetical protein
MNDAAFGQELPFGTGFSFAQYRPWPECMIRSDAVIPVCVWN